MQTILLPTDFSVLSLSVLKRFLKDQEANVGKYEIVFLFPFKTTNLSISELLFFNKDKVLLSNSNSDFNEGVQIIRNKYESSIRKIRYDILSDYNSRLFKNFVEGNNIDIVLLPKLESTYKGSGRKEFLYFLETIKKSKDQTSKVEVPLPMITEGRELLHTLFQD